MNNLESVTTALQAFIAQHQWAIIGEKDIQSGKQFRISDGLVQNTVDCYTNGNALVNGPTTPLKEALQAWVTTWRTTHGIRDKKRHA